MVYVNMYNAGLRYAHICQRASSWSETRVLGTPGLWCQLLYPLWSLCHSLEWMGVLNLATGLGMVFSLKTTYGVGGDLVWVRGAVLAAGLQPQITAQMSGAGSWRVSERLGLLPIMRMGCVIALLNKHVCTLRRKVFSYSWARLDKTRKRYF